MKIFDKLAKKFNISEKPSFQGVTNPIEDTSNEREFLTKMSKRALNLYEKQCDIKHFTKVALSDPENTSHNERVEQLLKNGVFDPLEDSVIKELAANKDLWDDLGM